MESKTITEAEAKQQKKYPPEIRVNDKGWYEIWANQLSDNYDPLFIKIKTYKYSFDKALTYAFTLCNIIYYCGNYYKKLS